jgi:RNA polymerase sigma-70 factor, ECF subfamily
MEERDFLDLIERNRGRLLRICRAYTRGESAQQDLFQEIVYQLWRSLPHFRGEAQPDTFLYRVAINTALTHVRREEKRQTASLDQAPPPLVQPTWEQAMDQQQQLKALYAAIDQLKSADRTLILLWLEEMSYQEMAEITGLSVNLIGVRLNRIRQRIERMLVGGKGS